MYYIDCTGLYGCGSHEKPVYPRLEDWIAELDRLGIWGAVTSHVQARDSHTLEGNRLLLRDIERVPGAKDRIIPALTIAPENAYEPETMAYYRDLLESGRVGALCIFPGTCRFRLRHLNRILDELSPYKPLLLVDINELDSIEALSGLADRYPEIPVILRNCMWGEYGDIYDLLGRHRNIYPELSHMHTIHTIPHIIESFGRGRLVFGKGYRALSGASMAAIRYSGEEEAEQQSMAGGLLLSLLPNREETDRIRGRISLLAPKLPNSLFQEFMRGKGLTGLEIIDAHSHIVEANSPGWYSGLTGYDTRIRYMLDRAAQLGVSYFVSAGELRGDSFEENRMHEKMTAFARERISLYYAFNPIYAGRITMEELDARFRSGAFVGFKILADYWHTPVTDPGYIPAYEYADRHHLPILFHSWEGAYDTPEMIAQAAERYPEAIFLIGHSGGGDAGRLQAEKAALSLPNIRLEFCGSFCAGRTWRETLDVVGADRVIFGSDTQCHDQAWELGRLLSENITDDELRGILGVNMRGIMARRIFYTR